MTHAKNCTAENPTPEDVIRYASTLGCLDTLFASVIRRSTGVPAAALVSMANCHIIAYADLELLEVLGEGAEGIVRKGRYASELVAIKIARINTVVDLGGTEDEAEIEEALEEAQAEAKVMKQLRHPHIVLFYGISLHAGSLGLSVLVVMELCSASLEGVIRAGEGGDESPPMVRRLQYALDVLPKKAKIKP